MNLVEALRTNAPAIRRPIAKHLGSSGDGWISSEYVWSLILETRTIWPYTSPKILNRTDILADDWEVRP